MTNDVLKAMKEELSRWQALFEELRVKTSLGKMEVRDKLADFEKAYEKARNRLSEWKDKGSTELDATTAALDSGWEKLRDTYRETKQKHRNG